MPLNSNADPDLLQSPWARKFDLRDSWTRFIETGRSGYSGNYFQPGGSRILEVNGGKDVTRLFKDYHADWETRLAAWDYLRNGRIVAEKYLDELGEYEIAMNGRVYDVKCSSCTYFQTARPPFVVSMSL
jgi:hypothetical protein